jgi:hypothetical protein
MMIKLLLLIIAITTMMGCAPSSLITTDNPTDPEADSPLIIDETSTEWVPVPWGCMTWKQQSVETPGVWYPKQKCCPLEPDENDGWKLVNWDC